MKLSINPQSDEHKPFSPTALACALLVNLSVFALIAFGLNWKKQPPLEAELWDAGSLAAAMSAAQNSTAEPTPQVSTPQTQPFTPKVVEPTPQEQPEASDEINTHKTPKTTPPANISKPTTPTKPATPPHPESNKPTQQPSAAIPSKKPSLQINSGGAGSASQGSGDKSAGIASLRGRLKPLIERNGSNKGLAGASGTITVKVVPGGRVAFVGGNINPPSMRAALAQAASVSIGGVPPELYGTPITFSVNFK